MLKRTGIILAFACALALGLALQATPAQAQQSDCFTYVSDWAIPRAQWGQYTKDDEQDVATMKRLLADGTIIAWGTDMNYVHTEDGYTHESFFTTTSMPALLKALDAIYPPVGGAGAFPYETKHQDLLLHTIVHNGKTATTTSGFLRVTMWQAKAGQGDALEDVVKKYIVPQLDAEVADGTVLMYNFDNEAIHTDAPGGFFLAVFYPSADAMEKAHTSMMAAEKDNPAVGELISNLTVVPEHRDALAKLTAYQHK